MMSPWLVQYKCRLPMKWKRTLLLALILVLCAALISNEVLLHIEHVALSRPSLVHDARKKRQALTNEYIVDTPGCKIPNINPMDSTVAKFINPLPHITCNFSTPLTYTDGVYLRINRTALDHVFKTELDYCEYQEIYRPRERSDNAFAINKTTVRFNKDVTVRCEFIRLACYSKDSDMIYGNFHAFIQPKTRKPINVEEYDSNYKPPNILMIGLDSVSRLNFIRQMPQTRNFLLDTLDAIELQGYNKVADNTLVNLVPMLAGKYLNELPWDETQDWVPFDAYDFIWKTYQKSGYTTLFAEDAPEIAIFNYMKDGFHKPPTDYYFRPYSLAIEDHGSLWNNNHDCFRDLPETEIVLNWAKDFMTHFKNDPYFAFMFLTRLTHEDVNKAGSADLMYKTYLETLHKKGLLENTVLLFFSDHGIRFGPVRRTHIGKLEERLPFLYMTVPDRFKLKFPSSIQNMILNQYRLTSPFDIYETLLDILNPERSSLSPLSFPNSKVAIERGISLFSVIPEERTCDVAGIESHWCACHQNKIINNLDKVIVKGSLFVVEYINTKLQVVSEYCEFLFLANIEDALYIWNSRSNDNKTVAATPSFQDYLVTFVVGPGGGAFEVTLRHRIKDDSYDVLGGPSRVNSYGNGGKCIKQHSLQKYCYCREEGDLSFQ